jgi:prolipoprotein diacylglyceryltransferase
MGMVLSVPMLLAGIALVLYAAWMPRRRASSRTAS